MDFKILVIYFIMLTSNFALSMEQWNDLRIRFSQKSSDGFYRVDRTFSKALSRNKWTKSLPSTCVTSTDTGYFYGYQVRDKENGVALLYDVKGVIAGMQTLYAHKEFLTPENRFRFDLVPMFQNFTLEGHKYFLVTVYFVAPEIICESGRAAILLEKQGTGDGIWIQNGTSPLSVHRVHFNRQMAIEDGWGNQNCFPSMGWHNFYEIEKMQEKDCLENLPIFLLYSSQNELIGFGFRVFGRSSSSIFESAVNSSIRRIIGDPLPECLLTLNDLVGTTVLHVYFIDQPWRITCP